MSHSLGLNISLPSGTLSQLKSNRSSSKMIETQNKDEKSDDQLSEKRFFVPRQKSSLLPGDGSGTDSYDHFDSYGSSRRMMKTEYYDHSDDNSTKDDRMIMPFIPSDYDSDKGGTSSKANGSEDDGERDESEEDSLQSDYDSLDDISLAPPASLPLLAVELEKLCGYIPSDEQESKRLADELCEALLGKKEVAESIDESSEIERNERTDDQSAAYYGDGLSLDFTARAVELLEAGVAFHCDTLKRDTIVGNEESDEKKLKYAFVPYPEFIKVSTSQCKDDEPSIMATTKIWKRIVYPHNIPVVHRLLKLLSNCSRSLMWKYEMALAIRKIAKDERRWCEEKKRRQELKIWRRVKRPDELAKLYEVRETFEMKLDMIRTKYEGYVKEREERVQKELLRRKEKGIGNGGLSSLDWDGNFTFAFDDNVDEIVQKMMNEKQKINGDLESIEYQSDDGYDCDSDDIKPCHQDMEQPQQIADIKSSNIGRKYRRAKAAAKRLRQKLDTERERAKGAELRLKVISAHEEEERVRISCINTDEKLAMVMVSNLEKQVEKIDDLLDSLQMDAWQDEEDGLLDSNSSDEEEGDERSEGDTEKMTLLDNILAMILMTLHKPEDMNTQEHYKFIKQEHDSIVTEWKVAFGRLPKLTSSPKPDLTYHDDCWSHSQASNYDDDVLRSDNIRKSIFESDLVPDDWEDEADSDFTTVMAEELSQHHVTSVSARSLNGTNDNSSLSLPKKNGLRPGTRL